MKSYATKRTRFDLSKLACSLLSVVILWQPIAAFAKEKKQDDAGKMQMADEHSAPCLSWIDPLAAPRAALLCIHGLGLSSDAYTNFGQRVSRRGIATFAIDVRGFGSWMRLKGNDQIDFDACLADIKAALVAIRSSHPGLPVFLLGESMGGAIALRACSMYPELIDGLVSSVPAGSRFQQKKTDLQVALKFFKGRHKEFNMGNQVVAQASGDNEKLKKDWEDDPLDRMDFSAEQLMQFQKFMNENHDAAKKITTTPVMMLQGSQDTLVKPEGTWDLFNTLPTTQKTFIELPSEHLVLEEGQAKSLKYDARAANLVAGWVFGAISDVPPDAPPAPPVVQVSTPTPIGALTAHGVPTILVFTAPWCVECQQVNNWLKRAQTQLGNSIKIKMLDVDDMTNFQLAQTFSIAPIPTFVFLNRNGSVNSTLIGRCRFENFEEHARAMR